MENGWTQQNVADLIGTSKSHYANIERGIRLPSYESIVKLQRLFQMPIDELLDEYLLENKNSNPTPTKV